MVEDMKTADTNTKTQLSLAAALFFSPLVQNILKKWRWDLTDKDKEFVRWYIRFWYVTLLFWILTITFGVLDYFFSLKILSVVYTVSIFILLFLLLIGIVSILSDISLVRWRDIQIKTYTIEGNKSDIIFKYLPLYDIYLRYQSHSFDKPNRRIKESIVLWTLFSLVCITGSIFLSSILLIIIIFRVASLLSDIDFLNMDIKQRINKLFLKNPEEIFWYISGFVSYLGKSLVHTAIKIQPYSLEGEIRREKEVYSRIISLKEHKMIIVEYVLWVLLVSTAIYLLHPDFSIWTYYVWLWLLLARYATMAIHIGHLPHLPIARELLLLIITLIHSITKRPLLHHP